MLLGVLPGVFYLECIELTFDLQDILSPQRTLEFALLVSLCLSFFFPRKGGVRMQREGGRQAGNGSQCVFTYFIFS